MISPSGGLIVLDKPAGFTSFDCVHKVREITGEKRVGHCGTLDPMAEGVLILLLGAATRLQDSFLSLEKQYWFRAKWGSLTETGDREGKEIQRFEPCTIDASALDQTLQEFKGEHAQIPPKISALKYKGRRYYDWTRRGIEIPRVARTVRIDAFDLLDHQPDVWEARVVCSRGTYVRVLAEDVAARFHTGAYLDALIRERVGPYRREDGLKWSTVLSLSKEQLLSHVQEPNCHYSGIV